MHHFSSNQFKYTQIFFNEEILRANENNNIKNIFNIINASYHKSTIALIDIEIEGNSFVSNNKVIKYLLQILYFLSSIVNINLTVKNTKFE